MPRAFQSRPPGAEKAAPLLSSSVATLGGPPQASAGATTADVGDEPPSACVKWWRAEWNFKPRGPQWLPAIIRMTWYLQVINMLESIQNQVNGDIAQPFFYSRTSCCGNAGTPVDLPTEFDVVRPETLEVYGMDVDRILACDLPYLPSEDERWSYSVHCPNPEYVRFYSQRIWAWRNSLINIVAMAVLPIGAGLSDTFGRKPVLVFDNALTFLGLCANVCASLPFFIANDPTGVALYVSGLLNALASASGPVGFAMLVDIVPYKMREQGFPTLAMFGTFGPLSAFGLAYYFLSRRYTSYTLFWLIFVGINFSFFCFMLNLLPETMPKAQRQTFAWRNLNPVVYYWRAIRLIFRYPIMIGMCLMVFTVNFGLASLDIAYNQLLLGPLQYNTASALFITLAGYPVAIVSNGIAALVIPRYGAWRVWFISMGFVCFGFVVYGLWSVYFAEHRPNQIWIAQLGPIIGGSVIATSAGCFATPAYQVIVSKSVRPEEQATAQSMISLVSRLAYVAGSPFYTFVIYEVGATGHRAVLFVYICAGLMALSGVIMAITLASVSWCCKEQGWEVLARDTERNRRVSIGSDSEDHRKVDDRG